MNYDRVRGLSHNTLMWILQLVRGNSLWIAVSISWQHFQIIIQLPILLNIFIANENMEKKVLVSLYENFQIMMVNMMSSLPSKLLMTSLCSCGPRPVTVTVPIGPSSWSHYLSQDNPLIISVMLLFLLSNEIYFPSLYWKFKILVNGRCSNSIYWMHEQWTDRQAWQMHRAQVRIHRWIFA